MTTTTCKTSVPFSFGDADQSTFEGYYSAGYTSVINSPRG
jgi:hypothetical protein